MDDEARRISRDGCRDDHAAPVRQVAAQQPRRIVADSRGAGASVQEVAERHGVRANVLSAWRRQDASRAAKPVKLRTSQGRYDLCATQTLLARTVARV